MSEILNLIYYVANIGAFTTGNAWSWSATAFPSLEEDTESDFHLSSIQYDWLASVIFVRLVDESHRN